MSPFQIHWSFNFVKLEYSILWISTIQTNTAAQRINNIINSISILKMHHLCDWLYSTDAVFLSVQYSILLLVIVYPFFPLGRSGALSLSHSPVCLTLGLLMLLFVLHGPAQ